MLQRRARSVSKRAMAGKEERFLRGPYKSAEEVLEFLMEEYIAICRKGFWMVLPYDSVKNYESL
jgi:hypothetical protein